MFLIRIDPFFQVPIVQMTAHGKLVLQPGYLGFGWINAVFIGHNCFHLDKIHIIYYA
jgi:hypothetical protein